MNSQQQRFIESFKAHIPTYEQQISAKFDLEQVIPLDDPPKLFEVDVKPLSSYFLNTNPQFQTLLSSLISWNETVSKYNSNPPRSIQKEHNKLLINNTIFSQLARILNEIVATTDRKLQLQMLSSAFDWYYQEIGRKTLKNIRGSSEDNRDSSRPTTSLTQRVYKAGDSSFETGGFRSDHANFEPPKVRLKDYSRRIPNYNDFSMSSTTGISFQRPGFNTGDFSRPQTSPFGTGLGLPPNENSIGMGGRPRTTAGGTRNAEEMGNGYNTINIGNFLSKYQTNELDFETQGQALRREVHSSQEQQRKKIKSAGKGNFISKLLYESPEERRMEELWYRQRNKALAEKKEDEELVSFMREWASNKGRVDEELVRKAESGKYGSEFNEMKYETKKKVYLNENDADIVLHEYPEVENPENEYVKLENGMDISKLRVLNEPYEIKGGDEIFVERNKNSLENGNEFENDKIAKLETEKFVTPDKEKAVKNPTKSKVFDSIQSYNTTSTGLSLEKSKNQSVFQSTELGKSKFEERKEIITEEKTKEIDEKIRKTKEKAKKINRVRPATEHEKKRKFIKYSYAQNKDRLIGDICDSPVIKLTNKSTKKSEISEDKIKFVDFNGNPLITSVPNPLVNLESQISRQKIKETRNYYGNFIKDPNSNNNINNFNDNAVSSENKLGSLSIYARPLSQQHSYRKFSGIFSTNLSKEIIRKKQLDEIDQIKKRMGKWGVSCSTKTLTQSLVMPLVVLGEKFKIAEHGSGLFENPFNKIEKKKKKPQNQLVK